MEWAGWIVAAIFGALAGWLVQRERAQQQARDASLSVLRDQVMERDRDLSEQRASSQRRLRATEDEAKHAVSGLAKNLLPVEDALQRALRAQGDAQSYRDGVALVIRQLETELAAFGVKPVQVQVGDLFDPHVHESVAAASGVAEGELCVVSVERRGWWLHERLLRPAEVVVGYRVVAPAAVPALPGALNAEPTEIELAADEVLAAIRATEDEDEERTGEVRAPKAGPDPISLLDTQVLAPRALLDSAEGEVVAAQDAPLSEPGPVSLGPEEPTAELEFMRPKL
jgi:molecular chaperone GrpE